MRQSVRFLGELSTIALALCLALPSPLVAARPERNTGADAPLVSSPRDYAANALIPPPATTPTCGGEGEKPCGAFTEFFWDNGNLFCDRGLQATGFRVIGGPIYFNVNDWLDLNRLNLTTLLNLFRVDAPALKNRLNNLGPYDFVTDVCPGVMNAKGECRSPEVCGVTGCVEGPPLPVIPLPDFTKPGWNIVPDMIAFVGKVVLALAAVNLPAAIKGIPGGAPTIDFSFSANPVFFDFTSFQSALNSLKNFFTENPFLKKLADLVNDFVDPPGQCVNRTRRQQAAANFQQTWAHWAVMNQTHLARYEPVNWAQFIDTHNAFNNAADGYPAPNQLYSITDQLNMGARSLALDIHWYAGQLRLCHGQESHAGCAALDRYYANAVKEIGNWLRAHPDEVIFINFEDRSEGQDDEVNVPLAAYLNDSAGNNLVYTPEVARQRGFVPLTKKDEQGNDVPDMNRMIWPSAQDVRDAGKQVLVFSQNQHGGGYIWGRAENPFDTAQSKAFFFTKESYELGDSPPPPYLSGPYRCVAYTPDKKFDFTRTFTRLSPNDQLGLFTGIYEARSFVDQFSFAGLTDESRVAQLAKCQISLISLDFLQSKEQTGDGVCAADPVAYNFNPATCKTPDQRLKAAVWSWRENDKGDRGDAAMLNGSDGRWSSKDPNEIHPFACAKLREGKADTWDDQLNKDWKITAASGTWREGDKQCRAELGADYAFAVPAIGWQNEELKKKNSTLLDVWLNYNDLRAEGTWTINRRPRANAGPDQTANEGQSLLNGGGSTDPDGDRLSYAWSFGDGQTGTGAVPRHVYADNGSYTATLMVTDEFGGVNTDEVTTTVNNVAPSVKVPGGNRVVKENGVVTISPTSFTDPGFDCPSCTPNSQENFTASIDWGEGTVTAATISETPGSPGVASRGVVTGSYIYSDNGTYTVKVCVADDEGANTCRTFRVTVNNVPPTARLDRSVAINTAGGQAFLGRRGVKPVFSADGKDVGTDDLTFLWSFPPTTLSTSTRYFNNGASNDPPQSPGGLFPFSVKHPNLTTFNSPGLFTAKILVTDDDGGRAADLLPLIITDDLACTRDWRQQLARKGPELIDLARLNAYLQIIRFASAYFDDTNLSTPAQAEAILRATPGGPSPEGARKGLLEAWLNFASGGVKWGDQIKLLDQPFSQVIAASESILLKPNATTSDYKRAVEAAQRINQSICQAK
ncbi:MAG TPA: PKD domain-containing protein [Pyrinomonadaceae bacterium]|nr:PKD domain-containing protein [Pyrinomonadaceae bacterium]